MITAFDYQHILQGLRLGLKAAQESCESTDLDQKQIDYAIRLLQLNEQEYCPTITEVWGSDQRAKYGND